MTRQLKCAMLMAGTAMIAPASAFAQATPSGAVPASSPSTTQSSPSTAPAGAQVSASNDQGIGDIIVTAQKRNQALNSVGLTITALNSAALAERGVQDVADLAKVVPGFVYAPSQNQTPVFTLRGVGVYESGFATSPAVTIYTDEVPLPYPIMQVGAGLDLERVEVLKGPQGTLFGSNSTGGAINYIAAKPTDHLTTGGSVTVARFGEVNLTGFISGPLSDTLKFRLSAAADRGGAWQQSVSRPGDANGDKNFYQGRLLVNWQPNSKLTVNLNLNGFYDNSQVLAGQLKFSPASVVNPAVPFPLAAYAGNTNVPSDFFTGPTTATALPQVVGNNARLADWNPDFHDNRRSNAFFQVAVRGDYIVTDTITLTSQTSFERIREDNYIPGSGTALPLQDIEQFGSVNALNQELRLSGASHRLNWVVGGAYNYTDAVENDRFRLPGVLFALFDFRGLDAIGLLPPSLAQLFHLGDSIAGTAQKVNEYAGFGNVEYKLTDRLTALAGLRYTANNRSATSCDYDTGPNNQFGQVFDALQLLLGKGNFTAIPLGGCFTLDAKLNPGAVRNTLNQGNLSWRFGLNYKLGNGTLLYATQSRGYKAGVVSVIGASSASQLNPIGQERLDAYEVGFKAPIGRSIQVDGAAFYYDYRNKQVRGRVKDPVFGVLETLISVPKSSIYGFEGSIDARPLRGLTTAIAATYLHSKVLGDFNTVTQSNIVGDLGGSRLPYTPKVSVTGDIQYEWSLSNSYQAFVGASGVYHSVANTTFQTAAIPAPEFDLPAYVTLDLRAGFGPRDERWRFTIFGRNVTNTYYLVGAFNNGNQRFVYTALPATYGATLSVKLR